MKVALGFSGEMTRSQWRKGDVEVDEVDLLRILTESGFKNTHTLENVPRRIAFLIMEAEAAQLLYTELKSFGGDPDECKMKIDSAMKRQQEAIETLKEMWEGQIAKVKIVNGRVSPDDSWVRTEKML